MYCSSCGVAVAQNRSYCNHCGAKLNRNDGERSSEVKPDLLIRAMVTTFMFGLAVITVLMGVMKSVLGLPVDRILGLMLFPFGLMLVLEGVFLWLLLRSRHKTDENRALPGEHATNELDEARARLLSQPATSVTEHTTRAFDPIYSERKQK